jgi:hypothetical protein
LIVNHMESVFWLLAQVECLQAERECNYVRDGAD